MKQGKNKVNDTTLRIISKNNLSKYKRLSAMLLIFLIALVSMMLVIKIDKDENELNSPIQKLVKAMQEDKNLTIDNTKTDESDSEWNKTSTRPFLYYRLNSNFGGVDQKNYIHVFAFEGDTICVGSNIYNSNINLKGDGTTGSSHEDKGSIDIVMHDLDGNLIGIDINKEVGSPGYIPDYATEQLAKTMTLPTGKSDNSGHTYVPYTYIVKETGIYTFEFSLFLQFFVVLNIKNERKAHFSL